jgi:hypothetical protein
VQKAVRCSSVGSSVSGLWRFVFAVLVGTCAFVPALAAEDHPDFTGVWGPHVGPDQTSFRRGAPPDLPLTPEGKRKIDEYNALVRPTQDGPGAHCVGLGMPAHVLASGGYPLEIIQRPEQITMIYEVESETRRIYFGDRNLPERDRVPDRNGYSSGRWEGDTLVVDTTYLEEQVDETYAHSDRARIVERFHLTTDTQGATVLTDQLTLIDPMFYTRPVTVEKQWALIPNGHVMSYNCTLPDWLKHLDALRAKAATTPPAGGR